MKIVIAPDSFKESLSASDVADALEKGFLKVFSQAEIVKVPLADGGEGTVQTLVDGTKGKLVWKRVTGPLGKPVDAYFGILGNGKTAVIEMASASGLHLVPINERNPLITTTKGTGELILAALEHGIDHLIIGIGGSATNDGGAGMAQALGVRLLDNKGTDIREGGSGLKEIASIDLSGLDHRLKEIKIEVACDVDNPLIGPKGASYVFGPQKGASASMVEELDINLAHYAKIIKRDLGFNINNVPGAGAAGGLGAGLLAFLSAELKSGIEIVMDVTNLSHHLKGASFVITGEGKIDNQTIYGKTPIGVAKRAKELNVPVIACAGSLGPGSEVVLEHGIDAIFSIIPGVISLPEALEAATVNIENFARNIASVIKLTKAL